LGQALDDNQIKDLQKMFYDNGAIDFVKSLIKKYAEQAQHILDEISFEDEYSKSAF
jgi:geranylgeranyl pyrophosphate synthase